MFRAHNAFYLLSCYSISSIPGSSSLSVKLSSQKNGSWLPWRQVDCWQSRCDIYRKKKRKIRVEVASFLDERIVDMSAEILRAAEIKIWKAGGLDKNMLSTVHSTFWEPLASKTSPASASSVIKTCFAWLGRLAVAVRSIFPQDNNC